MRTFKIVAILLLALQLVLPVTAKAENVETLDYLALGDSLAAGIQSTGELGQSYADYLAKTLTEDFYLGSYNKGFSYPGYTTTDVLNDLNNNVTKSIYNLDGPQKESLTIKEAIKNAEIITISAGANDLLQYFNRQTMTLDLKGAFAGIQQMKKNYDAIFKKVKEINPDAIILVMGYYNPFPHLDESLQLQLSTLVSTINKTIADVAAAHDVIYVDTADYIASDFKNYVPNPQNIHLSAEGYELVAELFYTELYYYLYSDEVDFQTFADTEGHWAEEYIAFITTFGFMKGYDDGTFKPDQAMTRAQVASTIAYMVGEEYKATTPFIDIAKYDQETQQNIAIAYGTGIMKGSGDYFKPEEKVTRAQMALIIARLYEYVYEEKYEPKNIAPFKDINSYNKETQKAITFLYDQEIAAGVSKGKFAPQNAVTRAQAAKMFTQFLMLLEYE